jgi:hypothetical protein
MRNNTILYLTSLATLFLLFGVICVVGFWLMYPYKTFTQNGGDYKVVHKEIKAGENLVFISDTCRHRVGEVEVRIALVDHILIGFPAYNFLQEEKTCSVYENRSVYIPTNVEAGEYFVEITSTMRVNPLRTVSTKFKTETFNVIK